MARRYAIRKVIVRAQWGFLAVVVLCWVLMISEHAAFPFVAIAAIATLMAVWQGVDVVRNGGVLETPEGITNRRVFGYKRWRWGEIERFTHVRSRVYLVTSDRRVWPLAGVNEGWLNVWEDGQTREITALLNERLNFWLSERAFGGKHAASV